MNNPILTIDHFTKTYPGGKKAVNQLSLSVEAGDIYGFIGHNGAGKSTTIRAVAGVLEFSEGTIKICGHDVQREPVICKSVTAYIPDNPDIYDYLTGIQFLNYIADLFDVSAGDRKARITEYSELLGMADSLSSLIASYSHGMKQKLVLISAFIHAPRLLILDEPFVGLDPEASYHLKNIMKKLCDSGCAIFFSTHVLEVAEKLCNKIAIIKNGQLIASGLTEEVRGNNSLEEVFMEGVEHDS